MDYSTLTLFIAILIFSLVNMFINTKAGRSGLIKAITFFNLLIGLIAALILMLEDFFRYILK